jgi:hypothetical protein
MLFQFRYHISYFGSKYRDIRYRYLPKTALINTQMRGGRNPPLRFSQITFERIKIFRELSQVPTTISHFFVVSALNLVVIGGNRKCNSTKKPGY